MQEGSPEPEKGRGSATGALPPRDRSPGACGMRRGVAWVCPAQELSPSLWDPTGAVFGNLKRSHRCELLCMNTSVLTRSQLYVKSTVEPGFSSLRPGWILASSLQQAGHRNWN